MRQLCIAIVVASVVLPFASQSADASICPTGQQVIVLGDGSSQCAHDDTPPVSSTRTPEFYSAAAEARALSCFGDGEDGRRLQALYVTDGQSPFGTMEQSAIVLGMINAEVVYENSSLAVSDTRLLPRWVLTPDCEPSIQVVTVQPGALDDFGATIRAVAQLGFDRPDRKYIMWADSDRLCGIASVSLDDRKRNNANDGQQPGYARIDRPCWGYQGTVVAHEVTHTFGAVMPSAPHATSLGHCTDDYDIMCYEDAPGATMQTICPDKGGELLLDCNNDDYFHPEPPAGSWLHTHWNVADSSFLERIPPGGGVQLRFADVGFDMPLGEAIEWLADRGITRGCDDTRFCPDDPVTRGQMAAFLHRFVGGGGASSAGFTDVGADAAFAEDIGWLTLAGVTQGCDATLFCPDQVVTRGQMAAFMYRLFGGGELGAATFLDVPSDHAFSTEIGWLAQVGVSNGCGNGNFCPGDPVTRGQMAAFLFRVSETIEGSDQL